MGRTRTFDETDAARSALEAFWDHGLEGTAIPDLEKATGLSRSSTLVGVKAGWARRCCKTNCSAACCSSRGTR